MNPLKKKQPTAVLGLTFEGRRLESTVIRKGKDGLQTEPASGRDLSLNPLKDDPILTGREIRKQLDEVGIQERKCVVGVPLDWTLTHLVKLPEVAEEHLDGFIQLQAEKAFPFGLDDLSLSVSRFETTKGDHYALLTAVPKKHIDLLLSSLSSAGLTPLSLSLGITALSRTIHPSTEPTLILFATSTTLALLVCADGGIVTLRSLPDVLEGENGSRKVNGQALARQLRITLGQLPEEIHGAIRTLHLHGAPGITSRIEQELAPKLEAINLALNKMGDAHLNGAPLQLPFNGHVPTPVALAADFLTHPVRPLEYLPPKTSQWEHLAGKIASRKFTVFGGAAGALILITLLAFILQGHKLSSLDSEWNDMEDTVEELEDVQASIRKFRGWSDPSQPNLRILRTLTKAFPEDGSVVAKSFELRDQNTATCVGTARNNQALIAMQDRLREIDQVSDLKTENLRGRENIQFTFTFKWSEGGNNGN